MLHAGYSAYEFHSILKSTNSWVPSDIILEVVVALIIINYGAIQSIRNKPRLGIGHDELVQPAHPYLRSIHLSEATCSINRLGVTEFEELDTRPEFINVKQKRKEYAEWASK